MSTVNRKTAEHYVWGEHNRAWRLVDEQPLSVIEEEVSAGSGETWHVHRVGRQFFYILAGQAVMCTEDGETPLSSGSGISIPAGATHRFVNRSDDPVRFLVISAPSTRKDRDTVDGTI